MQEKPAVRKTKNEFDFMRPLTLTIMTEAFWSAENRS